VLVSVASLNSLFDPVLVDQITRWESEFRMHLTAIQGELFRKISEGVVSPEVAAVGKEKRGETRDTLNL